VTIDDPGNACAALITELDHPINWSLTLDADGVVRPATDFDPSRRQAHTAVYRPVGCYCCSAEFLRTHQAFCVPGVTAGVPIPADRAIDIDTNTDLETARTILTAKSDAESITLHTHAGERTIGPGHPCFVIAEAGVNHNGDPDLARALIDAAADAGADAVKFQTFRASELVTDAAAMAAYQRTNLNLDDGDLDTSRPSSQADMLRALELADTELARLKAHAEDRGLVFLSSPFDIASARLLADLGVCALKLGSGELTNHPFLADLATLGLPLLLSTGMATLDECEAAADHLRAHGGDPRRTLWFHCVSAYPAPASATNLRAMDSLRTALCAPVGMSDHSMGDAVAIAAVARGAVAIEKHLTLSRAMEGPDHAASLEPEQFAEMVRKIRLVESALGDGVKQPAACEIDTIRAARRSLVAAADLPAGHTIRAHDLVAKRPGDGICPTRLSDLIGRTLQKPLTRDQQIAETDLVDGSRSADRSVA
jgi:N,N'-diacetyllegionaminate synthase